VSQLAWLGIDAASLQALRPYVVLLPVATAVNVNTASKEVLIAAIKGLDAASAERLVQIRQRAPFRDMGAFRTEVPTLLPLSGNLDVRSSFFEVRGRLRLADHVLTERSLVQRLPNGQSNVLLRERIASLEQVGE
jgi:general secretion pathway protein K